MYTSLIENYSPERLAGSQKKYQKLISSLRELFKWAHAYEKSINKGDGIKGV